MGKLITVHGGGAVTGSDIIEQLRPTGQEISEKAYTFTVSHMHAAYVSCTAVTLPALGKIAIENRR